MSFPVSQRSRWRLKSCLFCPINNPKLTFHELIIEDKEKHTQKANIHILQVVNCKFRGIFTPQKTQVISRLLKQFQIFCSVGFFLPWWLNKTDFSPVNDLHFSFSCITLCSYSAEPHSVIKVSKTGSPASTHHL